MAEVAKKQTTSTTPAHKLEKTKETKAERFTRLGQKRVPRALKAIATVRNLASRTSYEYTPEQSKKIVDALTAELSALRQAFEGRQEVLSLFSL